MKRCGVCKIEKDVMYYLDVYLEGVKPKTYFFCSESCIKTAYLMLKGEAKEQLINMFPEVLQ